MRRLFLSLYLVVVAALFIIGWTAEQAWRYVRTSSDVEISQVAQLSKAIRLLNTPQSDALAVTPTPSQLRIRLAARVQQLSALLMMPVTLENVADIAWLASQRQQLQQGETVVMYDNQDNLLLYLLLEPQMNWADNVLVKIGPIPLQLVNDNSRRWIVLLSYALLALAIGCWSWPLWRDLTLLQQFAEQFGKGQWQVTPQVSKNSVIAPVVNTFTAMAGRISRLVEEQKELTNAVSHELRTPLSRLKFSLALLDQRPQPASSQQETSPSSQSIIGMQNDINELETLVDELLSYSRLESTATDLVWQPVNINQLLENLQDKLSINSNKTIELTIDGQIIWLCDGHLLERAVQNLLINALRYGQRVVQLNAEVLSDGLLITVDDDGEGIDPRDHLLIFKPFVRLDKSRTKKPLAGAFAGSNSGFGLGLAIVKRIADWHQGRVHIGQSPLGGASFSLLIPEQSHRLVKPS